MEDPTIQLHPLQNSRKRKFASSGSSSSSNSSMVEPDLMEIPPPATWKSKPQKQKSVAGCELIVLDDAEDTDDVIVIDEKIAPNAKGKKPMHNYLSGDSIPANNGPLSASVKDSMKGGSSSGVSFIDDSFDFGGMDLAGSHYDSECALLQAHFDSIDIPSGIEATVPWWAFAPEIIEPPVIPSSSAAITNQSNSFVDTSEVDGFQSWAYSPGIVEHSVIPSSSVGISNHSNSVVETSEVDRFQPLGKVKPVSLKKKTASKKFLHGSKHPFSGHATYPMPYAQTSGMFPPPNGWPSVPGQGPNFAFDHDPFGSKGFPVWQNASHVYPSPVQFLSSVASSNSISKLSNGNMHVPQFLDPVRLDDGISSQISPPFSQEQGDGSENSIVKKLEVFKKFDTLEDHSDHFFLKNKESGSQAKNSWLRKLADEWKMLERDLPGTIYVRVYEARMDLLRAVIVGADGTPYHDGLFFFDVHFPPTYPHKAPSVKYHAHGLRLNPNLYNCGKVCLSLLGTWSGSGVENWLPGKSNMLQVLLSIQGLILNAEPYYNEPGFANSKGNQHGRQQSKNYSENTFLLSLKTMLYTMRNPPKHFEDLVFGHFYMRAHDILGACRAYLCGVEVGSYEKCKPAAQSKGSNCSELLLKNLPTYIKSLVEAFTKIGVKDCEKFLVPVENVVNQPARGSSASRVKGRKFLASYVPPWNHV